MSHLLFFIFSVVFSCFLRATSSGAKTNVVVQCHDDHRRGSVDAVVHEASREDLRRRQPEHHQQIEAGIRAHHPIPGKIKREHFVGLVHAAFSETNHRVFPLEMASPPHENCVWPLSIERGGVARGHAASQSPGRFAIVSGPRSGLLVVHRRRRSWFG